MVAKEFINSFYQLFNENSEYYQESVLCYSDNKLFTDFITERLKELIKKDFYVSTEYFRIDVSGWSQRREKKYLNPKDTFKMKTYLWDLEIAIEHENDSHEWMDEVVKLLHIRCPLRVVIGYLPVDKRISDERYLGKVFDEIRKLNAFNENDFVNDEFIVIIGNSKCNHKVDSYFNYKSYKLTNKRFEVFD